MLFDLNWFFFSISISYQPTLNTIIPNWSFFPVYSRSHVTFRKIGSECILRWTHIWSMHVSSKFALHNERWTQSECTGFFFIFAKRCCWHDAMLFKQWKQLLRRNSHWPIVAECNLTAKHIICCVNTLSQIRKWMKLSAKMSHVNMEFFFVLDRLSCRSNFHLIDSFLFFPIAVLK